MKPLAKSWFGSRILPLLAWIKARSPRALVYSWASIIGLTIATKWHPDIILLCLVIVTSYCNSLAIYTLNDLFDSEVDAINAPKRAKTIGMLGRHGAACMVAAIFFIGLGLSFLINIAAAMITLVGDIVGLLYSAPFTSLKDKFLTKTLTIGIGGMLASVFGSMAAGYLNLSALYTSALFFIFLFVTSPINDLADCRGDLMQGRRTIPIVIGARGTIILTIFISLALTPLAFLGQGLLGFSMLAPLLVSGVSMVSVILIRPLLRKHADALFVRRRHKKIVLLHFVLQASLALGTL